MSFGVFFICFAFRNPGFAGLFSLFLAVPEGTFLHTPCRESISLDTLSFLFSLPRCTFKILSFFGKAGKGDSRVPESQGNSGECLLSSYQLYHTVLQCKTVSIFLCSSSNLLLAESDSTVKNRKNRASLLSLIDNSWISGICQHAYFGRIQLQLTASIGKA